MNFEILANTYSKITEHLCFVDPSLEPLFNIGWFLKRGRPLVRE